MDASVFAFLAAITLSTGILFGLAPALHVSKTNVNDVLKEGGRTGMGGLRARRWTGALIVGELALTLVLLAGAGFMMRSFLKLYQADDRRRYDAPPDGQRLAARPQVPEVLSSASRSSGSWRTG